MKEIILKHKVDAEVLKNWQTLWKESDYGHFFNTPEWFLAYCEAYKVKDFRLVAIVEGDKFILILPLVKEKMFGVSLWRSPGGKFLDRSSLLVKTITLDLIKQLSNFLPTLGNVYLQELDEKQANTLTKTNKDFIKNECSQSPYLPLATDPYRFLSKKNSSQIRGILRKNEGKISFKSFTGDVRVLPLAFVLDNMGTKSGQGKATFVQKEEREFIKNLIKKMPQSVHIDFVYYNRTPIIYATGFIYKKIYQAFTTAFDGNYRFLRPGKLLTHFKIQKLVEDKFTLLDFSRGTSALKHEFTELERAQYSLFYSGNILIRLWWKLCQWLFYTILESKILYGIYLVLKRRFLFFMI